MTSFDYLQAKNVVDIYVASEESLIEKHETDETEQKLKLVDYVTESAKISVDDGIKIMDNLGISESIQNFSKIALLNHNIGRYEQIRLTGDMNDKVLRSEYPVKNYGELGDLVLNSLIEKEIPNHVYGQMPIRKIVRDHVTKDVDDKALKLLGDKSVISSDIKTQLVANPNQEAFIGAITQIVQDIRYLDVYHKIIDGRYTAKLVDEPISDNILYTYYTDQQINSKALKQRGIWNPNIDLLIKLSYIGKIKLVSTLDLLENEDILGQMQENYSNANLDDAYKHAKEKIKRMKSSSIDGIIAGK